MAMDGTTPEHLGKCTACGEIFAVHQNNDGSLHPAGTDGTCNCGNDEFRFVAGE